MWNRLNPNLILKKMSYIDMQYFILVNYQNNETSNLSSIKFNWFNSDFESGYPWSWQVAIINIHIR